MEIKEIRVYQVDVPLIESSYAWAGQRSVSVFDSSVVEIVTNAGIIGYGEVCPLGPNYLPSYAKGVRAGLTELGPKLIGMDPLNIGCMNERMDYLLRGHPYVKSAVDVACWDILGKHCNLPIVTLLGGKQGESVELYRAISQQPPKQMAQNVLKYRAEGYRKFQLKLGGKVEDDIQRIFECRKVLERSDVLVADANTGWLQHEAVKIANAVKEVDVYIEQPCETYEECLQVRRHTNLPFVLDENVDSLHSLLRAHADQAADVVNIKISKLGGLTKARQVRDLCVTLGIAMTLEDTWGSDLVTAAIAHFAHSTPTRYRFSCTDFNSYNSVHIAKDGPKKQDGKMVAPEGPGLGVTPDMTVLGNPVLHFT
ncbi:hypothetical protein CAPTEDRAFT_228474 [Capitella teleta]|uniref:Mandelate racemase/muconate lactonizing enzyme C-terminal domain-containing protein n=1 Tax=Capitella teleta TaxID=283909 RepID=R7T3Y7_CAPTE|nr:hypothetical protein CAPTEDRAFT_228474 [Capitella teleta]|eukprot:ELT87567.1 hypothetical protein CAPTEDRAFT_228474 [Capitella teleta]